MLSAFLGLPPPPCGNMGLHQQLSSHRSELPYCAYWSSSSSTGINIQEFAYWIFIQKSFIFCYIENISECYLCCLILPLWEEKVGQRGQWRSQSGDSQQGRLCHCFEAFQEIGIGNCFQDKITWQKNSPIKIVWNWRPWSNRVLFAWQTYWTLNWNETRDLQKDQIMKVTLYTCQNPVSLLHTLIYNILYTLNTLVQMYNPSNTCLHMFLKI